MTLNSSNEKLSDNERTVLLIDYWKQTSNVQQHFNDVSMKLRNFAVVVFSGFLTGVGLSIHNNVSISIMEYEISAGILFALAGLIATQLIHFMDTYWYHVFLKSAVNTSFSIEQEIINILGVSKLSDDISSKSQNVEVVSLFGCVCFPIGWAPWIGKTFIFRKAEVDSTARHKIFYRWLLVIFIITGIGSIFTHSEADSDLENKPKANYFQIITVNNPIQSGKSVQESKTLPVGYIISGSNVRVRNSPSFNSEIIGILPIGKEIVIKDNQLQAWVNIIFKDVDENDLSGWVHRDYIASVK